MREKIVNVYSELSTAPIKSGQNSFKSEALKDLRATRLLCMGKQNSCEVEKTISSMPGQVKSGGLVKDISRFFSKTQNSLSVRCQPEYTPENFDFRPT